MRSGHKCWRRCCRALLTMIMLSVLLSSLPAVAGDPPIRLGMTSSLTGRYYEPSEMGRSAHELWVIEVNQRGGLLGRTVKLIVYDDQSDPQTAGARYRQLIEEDRVDLLCSPYSTPLTLAAAAVSEAHQMLMLTIGAASEKPWQRGARYLFQLYAPAKRQFIGLLDMMAQQNLRTLSLLFDDSSAFNHDIVTGIENWARRYRIEILTKRAYQDAGKELPGLLAEAKNSGASGLVLSAYSPDAHEMLRLMGEMNYRPPVVAMPIAPVHPDFEKIVGTIAEGIFAPSQWEPDERIPFPGTRRFIKAFTAYTGHTPSFHAAAAYAGCQLLEKAIVQTQSLDHTKLRDYIATLDTVTVLGRFKVDPAGRQVGHNSFIIQWQQGTKEIVWPQKMQTARPQF